MFQQITITTNVCFTTTLIEEGEYAKKGRNFCKGLQIHYTRKNKLGNGK